MQCCSSQADALLTTPRIPPPNLPHGASHTPTATPINVKTPIGPQPASKFSGCCTSKAVPRLAQLTPSLRSPHGANAGPLTRHRNPNRSQPAPTVTPQGHRVFWPVQITAR